MAEVKETVLIEIDISKPEAEKQIDAITKNLSELNAENKELLATNKELEKQGQKNSKQYLDNARQVEVNKQKITENTASRKGLIQTIVAEDNSIKALSIRNRELINQRNQISTATDAGRQKIAQINTEIDKNNATIKANSSALEKQRGNVGNYRDAVNALSPALGNLVVMFENTAKAMWKVIATPLGAALTAIALVLAPVISYLTSTGEGLDKVDVATARWSGRLEFLRDKLNKAGKAIAGEGESFTDAIVKAIPLLNVFIRLTEDAADAAGEYAESIDNVKDAEKDYGIEAAKTENEIKRLLLQAKNRTLEEEKRIDLIDKATGLEAKLVTQRTAFAQEELSLLVERNRERLKLAGIEQQADETQETFVENSISRIRDFDEKLAESLIESVKKLEEARSSGLVIEEKAQNQLDQLQEKREEKEIKAQEDRIKRLKEEEEYLIAQNEIITQLEAEEDAAEEERKARQLESDRAFGELQVAAERKNVEARNKLYEQDVKNKQKAAQNIEKLQQQALATAMQFFGRNRIASSAITLADTYLSAQKAYASQLIPGDPSSLIRAQVAAVLTTLQGLGRVAAINGLQFAKGGILKVRKFFGGGIANNGGVIDGPSHANGGVKFSVGGRLGFEAEGGEAIINRKSTAMFKNQLSAINQAGGGVKFANGGVAGNEIRSVGRDIERQFSSQDTVFQPVLVLEEFELKQSEVNSNKNRAVVISG